MADWLRTTDMTFSLYHGRPDRGPGSRPSWHPRARRWLRGGSDEGQFGLYLYDWIRANDRIETVLNIGTARGYSAVCAAYALTESDREGEVHTIDRIPADRPRNWHGARHPPQDPTREASFSIRELVDRVYDEQTAVPIHFHSGASSEVLEEWTGPTPDLVFHDGTHVYEAMRRDLSQTVGFSDPPPVHVIHDCHLFDDIWHERILAPGRFGRFDTVPKIGGLLRRLRRYALTKEFHPGVVDAVTESIRMGYWAEGEVVHFPREATITTLLPP